MSWDLAGKRALVTGGAGAFGSATIEQLRGRGATVLGLDLNKSEDIIGCDLTDGDQIRDAVAAAIDRLGGLDLLVNNAGIGVPDLAGSAPDAVAREVIEVNLFGGWATTAAALDELRKSRGRVVYPGYVPTPIHDASLARGVDLGLYLPAETVDQVVRTIVSVAAARRPPRNRGSTRVTGIGVGVARHLPSVADRLVRMRTNQQRRKGGLGELAEKLGRI